MSRLGNRTWEGGLLLRRDLHRLFDQGLLGVTPDGIIDVSDAIEKYDLHSSLYGQ